VLLIEPVVIATPLSVPPVKLTDEDAKLLAVVRPVIVTAPPKEARPLPKVTGLLVTVLIDRVPVVESMTGVADVKEMLPVRVSSPVALRVVNAPVDAAVAPIGVELILPPVIVAPDDANVLAVVEPVKLVMPLELRVVNAPVLAVVAPIGVLLIEPVVIATPLSVPPVKLTDEDAKLLAVVRPAADTVRAEIPLAETDKGLRAEPVAVARLIKYPVPVLLAVSVRLKRLTPDPVVAP
jgi:hypothetical protein